MATLVPRVAGRSLSSAAEKQLAERFRVETPDSWLLMHSVGFIRHRTKRWAEADFVLISEAGLFCLEVKGGRVACIDGVWTFTDRHGHSNDKYEGPFDQAGGVAGALQGWLTDNDVRRDDGSRFQVGYGVMTPDCVLDVISPSIEPELLLDQTAVGQPLFKFVEQLGRHWQHRLEFAPLLPMEIERLGFAIRPSFEARESPRLVLTGVQDELIRLTEAQSTVLEGLADNPRIIVSGPAGTGKTVLALAEAERLASQGRVLLTCFSEHLASTLADRLAGTGVVVKSIDEIARTIVDEADASERLPDAEEQFLKALFRPELATELLAQKPNSQFDAVIVDEAQDLRSVEYVQLIDALVKDGLKQGVWRLFQDPNQNLFGKADPVALGDIAAGNPVRYKLSVNCRNTAEIVSISKLLSSADVSAESPISGPDVEICDRWSDDPIERATDLVAADIDRGLAGDDIIVLAVRPSDLTKLRKSLRNHSLDVRVLSVEDFKGLDALAVVLVGGRDLDDPDHRQDMYVGTTRAKVRLSVVLPALAQTAYENMIKRFVQSVIEQTDG